MSCVYFRRPILKIVGSSLNHHDCDETRIAHRHSLENWRVSHKVVSTQQSHCAVMTSLQVSLALGTLFVCRAFQHGQEYLSRPIYRIYFADNYDCITNIHRDVDNFLRRPAKEAKLDSSSWTEVMETHLAPPVSADELWHTFHKVNGETIEDTVHRVWNGRVIWDDIRMKKYRSDVGAAIAAARFVCDEVRYRKQDALDQLQLFYKDRIMGAAISGANFFRRTQHLTLTTAANVILNEYPDVAKNVLVVDCDRQHSNGKTNGIQEHTGIFSVSLDVEEKKLHPKHICAASCLQDSLDLLEYHQHNLKNKDATGIESTFDLVLFRFNLVDGSHQNGEEGRNNNKGMLEFCHRYELPAVWLLGGTAFPRQHKQAASLFLQPV